MDLQEKKTYGYKERNEEKRAQFARVIATKHRDNLVYIDLTQKKWRESLECFSQRE
ncbi:hypothetical protein WwAna1692 [Wolbachia endosymbiont of Drosophila ananassae]|nr:hypothetical protein WwAna1692 [Wolbachia endosymbiont of Drosophila ananassae]RLT59949.1 hypothetical protein WANA13_0993 [Wolbachia endosymbiont of Drosophila ananassae]RLT62543.1 hypothetical protein WANA31_0725 [Wolbachia endosymbiont of Drosophila ananassae]